MRPGGNGSGGQPAGSIKITLTEFKFDPSTITVPHGKVALYLVDAGAVPYDLIIRDSVNNRVCGSELISAGDTFVFTIDNLPAVSYTLFCDQPGPREVGHERNADRITVKSGLGDGAIGSVTRNRRGVAPSRP